MLISTSLPLPPSPLLCRNSPLDETHVRPKSTMTISSCQAIQPNRQIKIKYLKYPSFTAWHSSRHDPRHWATGVQLCHEPQVTDRSCTRAGQDQDILPYWIEDIINKYLISEEKSHQMTVFSWYPTIMLQPRAFAWDLTSCLISTHQASLASLSSRSSSSSSSYTSTQFNWMVLPTIELP